MADLSLVPIDELFEEINNRSDFFACAYQLKNESTKKIYTQWKDNAWFGDLALVSALQHDILWDSFKRRGEHE